MQTNQVYIQERDGCLIVHKTTGEELIIQAPGVVNDDINSVDGHCGDVFKASKRFGIITPGIELVFLEALTAFKHRDTHRIIAAYMYTRDELMYGLFNRDSPVHLFLVIQCVGGLWAGIIKQLFVIVVTQWAIKHSRDALEILLNISKVLGCAARGPLIPRFTQGTPPDINVAIVDCIIARNKDFTSNRDELITSFRRWQIPNYIRPYSDPTDWAYHKQIDRALTFLKFHVER
jgi:hypothetical protein